jgi:hypothetical protein
VRRVVTAGLGQRVCAVYQSPYNSMLRHAATDLGAPSPRTRCTSAGVSGCMLGYLSRREELRGSRLEASEGRPRVRDSGSVICQRYGIRAE